MEKVSVIVPVYKVELYLRDCIDSILGQTYRNLQLILVDDGSPDNCGAICDEYALRDNRVLVLHKENGGVSSARNVGLDHADGTYITFCDSDDGYERDWIAQMVDAMEAYHPDVVVGGFTYMAEDGTLGSPYPHETGQWRTESEMEKIKYCFTMAMQQCHGGEIWDRLFRRDIVMDNQIRFCETCGNYAEDLGFVLSYSMYANSVAGIESCGYRYRVRSGSMMQTSTANPRLESLHQVYLSVETVCRRAFAPKTAQWMLTGLYSQLIAMQFLSKLWSSGMAPDELRKRGISDTRSWPEMEERLRTSLRQKHCRNPWYSGSYNAEIRCHIQYLLDGSWLKLRIRCKLIRVFRPFMDRFGRLEPAIFD